MNVMDIEKLASEFGSAGISPAEKAGVDVDALVSEFGSKKETRPEPTKADAITVRPVAPPISGLSQEESDKSNAGFEKNKIVNPPSSRSMLPKTDIGEKAYEADLAGKATLDSGIEDFSTGHPYKGAAKVLLGGAQRLMSPATGIIEGGVVTPVTDMTGNKDIGDRAGFVAGAALPVIPGSNYVAKALPKNKAFNTLIDSIGQRDLPRVVSELKANPRLAPADLSPKVLQDTQHLFVNEGDHINYLAETSAKRLAGSKGAVSDAMDASLGSTVNAVDKLKELKANIREVGAKEINPIVEAKPHTDVTSVINDIDAAIGKHELKALRSGKNHPMLDDTKKALYSIRNDLRGDWPDKAQMLTYTDKLHQVQSQLREKADTLKNSAMGSDRLLSKKLYEVREKLKDAIGPEYKAALGKYKDEIDIQDAFHHGHDAIIKNSKAIENRPEFFKDWVANASKEELHAAKEGARVAIDTQINGFKHSARRGTDVGEVEFNRARIETLFGKEEADKLFTKLQHERAIANTHNKVIEGSQTAMRTASKSQFALPTASDVGRNVIPAAIVEATNMVGGGVGGVGTAFYVGLKTASNIKDYTKMMIARRHNDEYARLAMPTEANRAALIKAMEDRIAKPKPSMLSKIQLALPVRNP